MSVFRQAQPWLVLLPALAVGAQVSDVDYVYPMIGGDQAAAAMIHTDVILIDTPSEKRIVLDLLMEGEPMPMLRPLVPPDQFDPGQPYAVLQGKAYNYQYAWNPGGFFTLPPGTAIWIERLHHDTGLQVYLRAPSSPEWSEVLSADSCRWKWSGAMAHNAYAVANPSQEYYQAGYRVYLGDANSGEPIPAYQSAEITWIWQVDLCLTHAVWADADGDDDVDQDDFGTFQICSGGPVIPEPRWCGCFDRSGDGNVNAADLDEFVKCVTGPAIPWSALRTPDCRPWETRQ